MCEIPSNVILAGEFATRFDGFSIGSNDLTQLTLGIDRDSRYSPDLFDEQNEAVKWMISRVIDAAPLQAPKWVSADKPPATTRSLRLPGASGDRFDSRHPGQLRRSEKARAAAEAGE
ncbi:MAG: putative PEP-binding protein [Halioglobus sp.]